MRCFDLLTRHEEYPTFTDGLPFVLHADLERTPTHASLEQNWHENLEIQLCTGGSGIVLVNGAQYKFSENDIVLINSNCIHYTFSDSRLIYTCLIISPAFCKSNGIDYERMSFRPLIRDPVVLRMLQELINVYSDTSVSLRTAKLNWMLLGILIELMKNHAAAGPDAEINSPMFDAVRHTITLIQTSYDQKLTLDHLARAAAADKYALCRAFKKLTGQTIFTYLNRYRCIQAAERLTAGSGVAQAAMECGFDNLSYFTRTFKRYMDKLPSEYK